MSRKTRRHFTDDFKQQIVDLHNAGMKRSEFIALRKRNKELEMQLDILKQAAVIMAQKGK